MIYSTSGPGEDTIGLPPKQDLLPYSYNFENYRLSLKFAVTLQ